MARRKTVETKDYLYWWIYDRWDVIAHFDQSGYWIDAERIAQKLESESGTLTETARRYIADRFIRRRTRKRGRKPKSVEEKLQLQRHRAIEYVIAIDAELEKVGGKWERLLKKGLFNGTVQSAKERYSRSKAIKAEWDRECLGYIREAAGLMGIPFDEYRAELRKRFPDAP